MREIELVPLVFGGERYVPVPEQVEAEVRLTRAASGTLFELRFRARVHGPCHRCLGDAVFERELALREYQAERPEGSDELTTPYVAKGRLDLTAWARDALALAMPDKVLCREDCAGLCPACGRDLNAEPHVHEQEADSRWSALEKLRDRL